jgi:hypothetical protein
MPGGDNSIGLRAKIEGKKPHELANRAGPVSKEYTSKVVGLENHTFNISLLGRGILDILSIRPSEAAVHQKNPKTVPKYVCMLGNTSYSKNGQNEWKQKSLCTKAHWDTQLAYTVVLSNVRS